ncbi:MAG: biotin--[acetyl-CoA-carboxylase] ligase [Oscillospiraceae bacterium]
MSIKQQLAELLESRGSEYTSGSEIAERLGVTRAAVWKSIRSLEEDGYIIDAVKNRGYRLGTDNDMVSAMSIKQHLGELCNIFKLETLDSVDSTNTWLKARAEGLSEWYAVIAGTQNAGRGRLGRSFFSPPGTGLYISVLLRPRLPASEASLITTAAAVAVCRAVEECSGVKAGIKWVNDVLIGGKKICGILTEASFDIESGGMSYAVLGVGINVYEPDGGFPEEIRDIAGAVFPQHHGGMRSRLAAAFLKSFYHIYSSLETRGFVEEYRARSILIGRPVTVIKPGSKAPAVAEDIDGDCRLTVRYPDGSCETLSSGEVSVRPAGEDPSC